MSAIVVVAVALGSGFKIQSELLQQSYIHTCTHTVREIEIQKATQGTIYNFHCLLLSAGGQVFNCSSSSTKREPGIKEATPQQVCIASMCYSNIECTVNIPLKESTHIHSLHVCVFA